MWVKSEMKSLRNVCLSGFERVKCPSHADFLFISPEDFIQNEVETWARICKTVAGCKYIFISLSKRRVSLFFISALHPNKAASTNQTNGAFPFSLNV